MRLAAVCIGRPEKLPGKSYKTGINKAGIGTAVLDRLGLVGDAVCNAKHHGGEDQAILLEGSLTLDWWAEQLGRPLTPGTFGENLVIEGLDNRNVAVGDSFHVGHVVLEASCPRSPCNTLAAKMADPSFARTYTRAGRPGIYCRVVAEGTVSTGDPVRHEIYSGERIMIPDMLAAIGRKLPESEKARFLAAPIGSRWRSTFGG
ncbi:MOSC domain-containing protein [Neorhizobium lilium]|uniref:MOSC domain-containing protein n=1 Tax=Neorhizobium lilium TaxID=2503024 RepID=A0A3S3VHA6_9HYPH|nr:MOSC domain-containing protein [Neorhizobium lilium]RWX76585.1 MOSC domain-containing protein [Neorhizobium lilium]